MRSCEEYFICVLDRPFPIRLCGSDVDVLRGTLTGIHKRQGKDSPPRPPLLHLLCRRRNERLQVRGQTIRHCYCRMVGQTSPLLNAKTQVMREGMSTAPLFNFAWISGDTELDQLQKIIGDLAVWETNFVLYTWRRPKCFVSNIVSTRRRLTIAETPLVKV